MQFPYSISFGNNSIPLHGIFEFLAFFVAFRYFLYLRKRQSDPINTQKRLWIIIGAIFGSIIGSRLVGGVEDIDQLMKADNKLLYFYLNKTVLGGFLGGLFGVELIKKMIGEKQSSGDLFTYPMILGLIIGRIGCFTMGIYEETYGTATTIFTGMDLGDGQMRHPVALYEIAFLLLLWIVLKYWEKKHVLPSGRRFQVFMIAYISFRFLLDFIKPHYKLVGVLSTIQLTCLLGLLYYAVILLRSKTPLIAGSAKG